MLRAVLFTLAVFNTGILAATIVENGDHQVAAATSTETDTAKSASPFATKEKIDDLAYKLLLIHGVQPGVQTEENLRNADLMREVVARVRRNLDIKLQEMRSNGLVQ